MSFKLDEFESTCFYTLHSCILSFDLYQSYINVMKLHFFEYTVDFCVCLQDLTLLFYENNGY